MVSFCGPSPFWLGGPLKTVLSDPWIINRSPRTPRLTYVTALSNQFATLPMWRMTFLMCRITLFPNISKMICSELKYFFFILIHTFLIKTEAILIRVYFMTSKFCFQLTVLKMWRMALFICHICVERINYWGHRWFSLSWYFFLLSVTSWRFWRMSQQS